MDRSTQNPPQQKGSQSPRSLLFRTRVDVPQEERTRLIGMLNERLADTLVLFSLTKQAHWNVKGNDFFQLHKLFDELAEEIEGHADDLAERVTALGGAAQGTVHMAATCSTLKDFDTPSFEGMAFVEALAERYGQHAAHLREGLHQAEQWRDMPTSELLTGLTRDVEKALYFLESHLQKTPQR